MYLELTSAKELFLSEILDLKIAMLGLGAFDNTHRYWILTSSIIPLIVSLISESEITKDRELGRV